MHGDPSACREWYFRPARNDFNFGNKKIPHGARSGEYGGGGGGEANSYFFFLQKRRNYCGGMSVGIVMLKTDMFKTSGRASFVIILFQFLQYYVFVVLSGNAFSPALLLRLLHQRRRRLHTKPSLFSKNV